MTAKKASKAKPKAASSARRSGPGPNEAELERIRSLLRLMEDHGLTELEVGPDPRSVRLSKLPRAATPAAAPAPAPAPAAATPEPAAAGDELEEGVEQFLSPMVGTFYRASTPEAASYVVEGDKVQPDSVLCIIEAMKVFNEIRAEESGEIVQILVENGEAVEYGQPLFLIRKAG